MSRAEPGQETPGAMVRWAEEALGVGVERVEPVHAGLGLRRFFRLTLAGPPESAVLRVDAPEDPAIRPAGVAPEPSLEPVRALLERHGLPVPRRYAADPEHGYELLEDGGRESLCDRFGRDPDGARHLVAAAADLVPKLQAVAEEAGVAAFVRRLDLPLFRFKAELFAEYSLPLALGRPARASEADAVREAFTWIAHACADAPHRLAHRDFQSQNLLVRDGPGRPSLLMIDLQGAFVAPPEYDLVCLLRDSYLALDDAFVASTCERVRPALPDAPPADDFACRFDLLTLTRKGKDHARFLSTAARGNTRFLRYLAPTAQLLKAASRRRATLAPAMARLAELVEALPEEPAPCAP